jgi:uncharacterized protein (UPF0248 family)
MIPIQDLLHRIRWDPAFGRGKFEIAYLDKRADRLERIPLEAVQFETDGGFGFEIPGVHGEERFIPFHRVREVYRDGELIWQRPGRRS